jgi:uncharacterized membrane protein
MIKLVLTVFIYLFAPLLVIWLFRKYKIIKQIGTVIIAYAIGIIIALVGLMPAKDTVEFANLSKIQGLIQSVSIALAIPLMLFNCDFRLWTKSLPKTFVCLITGLISVIVAVVLSFFIFQNAGIDGIENVAAMFVGIYTGGTMNFYALGAALQVNSDIIVLAYTFEMLITFPFILFLVGGGYKLFRHLLPFKDSSTAVIESYVHTIHERYRDIEENGVENYNNMFKKHNFPKMLLGLLISFGCLSVGAILSWLITGKLNELVVILTISILAILLSFHKKIQTLPKIFELGMFFILIFSITVASQFDIYSINTTAYTMMLFVLTILLTAIILHVLLCRIFKVEGDLFSVGVISLICSPPFVAPLVGAMGNKKMLISGIVIGLVGYAIGTFLGILLSQILRMFV